MKTYCKFCGKEFEPTTDMKQNCGSIFCQVLEETQRHDLKVVNTSRYEFDKVRYSGVKASDKTANNPKL